mmetsp:Transcript_30710/g.67058  ORF Transcript_30710/g.67058 Transcript_30710/m.67058 type:complete len:303 (-) Transcript_30710:184-1092(-)|eukprot:CAMPEP_0118936002 /NCGR_PEP_ID=MMETSP1169-20130426/15951_1 /TAXON_ID=36882 /ORGANISM="Pyramimonas obovata, Strain CCMP722" /LENGTH=302 /DNA_ID=CAMNT_0006879091 /DNA_START=228 /DNA_END=1136 /DNA_ORIENTATION=+
MEASDRCEAGASGVSGESGDAIISSLSEATLSDTAPEMECSQHHVVNFDDANEGNEEAPLLQKSDESDTSLHFDPLKKKASTSGGGSNKLTGECRICQESDPIDQLETPCACIGSMLYAHKGCIQHWINEKGDTTCEICHKPFQGDYTTPAHPPFTGFVIPPLGVFDASRLHEAAAAVAERMAADAEEERVAMYSHYPRFLCLRLTIVFILSLFLLRIFFAVTSEDAESQTPSGSTLFIVSFIRLIGPLIPFILMYQAILSVRRQQLNVQNSLTRADVAWLLRDAQQREPHLLRIHTLARAV